MRSVIGSIGVMLTLVLVLLAILLPSTTLRWMRREWAWFNYPLELIDSADSPVNLVHAILFVLLGIASRLALPHWRIGRVCMAFLVFGVATELAQMVVPGRDPRMSDAVVDVLAGLLGWASIRRFVRSENGA